MSLEPTHNKFKDKYKIKERDKKKKCNIRRNMSKFVAFE
jgi:hypothetical protein